MPTSIKLIIYYKSFNYMHFFSVNYNWNKKTASLLLINCLMIVQINCILIYIFNRVDYVCYLGLTVDFSLSWKFHVNCVNDKIAREISLIQKCSHFMPGECLRSLYFAFIYPYSQYGIEFWSTASDKYLHNMLIL